MSPRRTARRSRARVVMPPADADHAGKRGAPRRRTRRSTPRSAYSPKQLLESRPRSRIVVAHAGALLTTSVSVPLVQSVGQHLPLSASPSPLAMREDALASVRRAYRIAGRDHGAHAPPPPISSFPPPVHRDPSRSRSPSSPSRRRRRLDRGLRPRARGPPSPLRRGVRALPLHRFPSRLPPTPRRRPRRRRPGDGRARTAPRRQRAPQRPRGHLREGRGRRHAGAPGGYAASKTRATASETSSSASDVQSSSSSTCGDARARDGVDLRWGRLARPGGSTRTVHTGPRHPRGVLRGVREEPVVRRVDARQGRRRVLAQGRRGVQTPERRVLRLRGREAGRRRRRARRRRAHGRARSPARFVSRRADIVRREGERRGARVGVDGRASRSGRGEDFRFGKISEGASAGGRSDSDSAADDATPRGSPRLGGSLLILVPTVARRGVDYLTRTVDSLLSEARNAETRGFHRVTIRVVSHSTAAEHPAFRAIRDRPAGAEDAAKRVSLEAAVDADRRRSDPAARDAPPVDDTDNPRDIPGTRVRQQTLDLVGTLRGRGWGWWRGGRSICCSRRTTRRCARDISVGSARASPPRRGWIGEWSMLRTSIGFIGIAIKRADANALADFLERHYRVKPPDILLVEWAHGDWGRGACEPRTRRNRGTRSRGGTRRGRTSSPPETRSNTSALCLRCAPRG